MKTEEFLKIVDEHNNGQSYGLCPQPFPADKGLNILIEHFLGKDWYTALSMSSEQVYTEAIADILDKTQPKSFFERLLKENNLQSRVVAELVDAQQETLVDFKTVRFSFVLGIVQNAGLNPVNSFYNNQVALEMQI